MATYSATFGSGVLTLSYVSKVVYFGGRAFWQNGKAVVLDRLGCVLARGNGSGGGETLDYVPYGEERGAATAGDRNKFGTYHRDQTGLDYADQRYYNSAIGRFMSSDPYLGSFRVSETESLPRFVYSGNDPVNLNDPSGLDYTLKPGQTFNPANPGNVAAGGNSITVNGGSNPTVIPLYLPTQGSLYFTGPCGAAGCMELSLDDGYIAAAYIPDSPTSDPCEELRKKMDHLVNTQRESGTKGFKGLAHRLRQMRGMSESSDPFKGYKEQVENMRRTLGRLLNEWGDDDCGDRPTFATDALEEPVVGRETIQQATQAVVAQTSLALLIAYGGYRAIRLLPSLFPPLWWTLPANVAIP